MDAGAADRWEYILLAGKLRVISVGERPVILITGASGFTGQHLVPEAWARGFRCVAASNTAGLRDFPDCEQVEIDLLDRKSTFDLVRMVQPQFVIHLAAVSFVAHGDLTRLYTTNIVGTINLVDAVTEMASQVRKVIIASSGNVYGNAEELPITESSVLRPQNDYAASKVAMEQAVSFRVAADKLILVRPFNYTGVGQASHFLVPKIVGAFARGRDSLELGNLDVSRDFTDVRDVVNAYLELLVSSAAGVSLNICSGRSVSLRSVVESMERISGRTVRISSNPDLLRRNEIPVLYGSDATLRSLIGEYRRYSFEETLAWMYHDMGGGA